MINLLLHSPIDDGAKVQTYTEGVHEAHSDPFIQVRVEIYQYTTEIFHQYTHSSPTSKKCLK